MDKFYLALGLEIAFVLISLFFVYKIQKIARLVADKEAQNKKRSEEWTASMQRQHQSQALVDKMLFDIQKLHLEIIIRRLQEAKKQNDN